MWERMPGLAANLIATFFMFLLVIVMRLMGFDGFIMGLTVLAIAGTLVMLWMVWALKIIESNAAAADLKSSLEKAKRSAPEDLRLSLLLELMGDDERQALKQRLLDDLGDGESVSLAALLAAQDDKRSSSR